MSASGPDQIRNVVLVGHSHEGKTSLAEAMLFVGGSLARLGSPDAGSSAMDFEPEEIKRKISITLGVAHVQRDGHKVNILDSPGFFDFASQLLSGLQVAEGAVVVTSASDHVGVGTEVAWEHLNRHNKPRLVVVNKLDKENTDFGAAVAALQHALNPRPVPIQVPIGRESAFKGVVDLLTGKAYITGADGKETEQPVPGDLEATVLEYRSQLMEAAAEGDDSLLEKYLDQGSLSDEEIQRGLSLGVKAGRIAPVLCASATRLVGVGRLLEDIVSLLPPPEGAASGPGRAFVFNTTADQYGKVSYFKVVSGCLQSDHVTANVTTGKDERLGQLFFPKGKDHVPTQQVCAGDVGAVSKLAATHTGDTLGAKDGGSLPSVDMPSPVYALAIFPRARGDEEKISSGLARLAEEDPSLHVDRNEITHQLVISGLGDVHLDVVLEKLRRKFGVEATTELPRLAYKETISGPAKAEGRHVKQSGGHGQYGVCTIEVRPATRGDGFQWEDKIFGGAIPQNFRPSVEKGIRDAMGRGIVAGYPMEDVVVALTDGKYHTVDSSDMAFQLAGSLAIRKAAMDAGPVLLEPIMNVEINVPEHFLGDVMSDLNTRRGKIAGTEPSDGHQIIRATVPEAEMQKFALDLRSITQGRGHFTMRFSHYEEMPAHLAKNLIDQFQKEHATKD